MATMLRAALVLLGAILSLTAQEPALRATNPSFPLAPTTGRVHVDTQGDGLVWAHGDDWKASFGPQGCTFVPFLGSKAPRNFPVTVELAGARCGDTALPLDLTTAARAQETQRVTIERGSLTEIYELTPRGIEQKFVFAERRAAGACSVSMRVTTELSATQDADGSLRFTNELGGVQIGKATAVDARGATAPATTTFANGTLVYTVPADFAAHATFPLTIDPYFLVTSFVQPPNGYDHLNPDIAYVSTFDGVYAGVFEEVFSATDHDVRVHAYSRTGTPLLADFVDFTTTSWTAPRVASHVAASQFLCVAKRNSEVGGRLVDLAAPQTIPTFVFGAQFTIVPALLSAPESPDVGGNPSPTASLPGNYCVTCIRNAGVLQATVGTDGVVGAIQVLGTPAFVGRANASVSKCCGPETGVQQWVVVWDQGTGFTDRDIHGALVAADGTIVAQDITVDATTSNDTQPQVSSKTDFVSGVDRWMVVWQRTIPGSVIAVGHDDIYGAVFQDATNATGSTNLTQLLNRPNFANQVHPCVDTDGTRFAVGFSEKASSVGNDWAPYLATVHLAPNSQLAVTAYPELLNGYVEVDDNLQITSEHSGGTYTTGYVAAWTASGSFGASALAAFYRGHLDLSATSYFDHAVAGCGAMQLVANGLPALGETMYLDLVGAQGIPLFLIGQSTAPVALCSGCELGIDAGTMSLLGQSSIAYTVPPDVTLIGMQVAAQGIDVFAPGGCPLSLLGFEFTLTDEIVATFL